MKKIKTDDWPDRTCNRCNLTYAAAERCCPNCCCPEFRLTDGDLADLDDEAHEMSDAEFDKADEQYTLGLEDNEREEDR